MVSRALLLNLAILRRRFSRNEGGATAVEFALIALPFLGLMAGIIELGLLFMGSVALDNAMQQATRQIRTGEIQTPAGASASAREVSRKAFRDEVCDGMGFMATDCKAKLSIDVQTVLSFRDINMTSPVKKGAFDPGALNFSTGTAGSIVMVTAYYRWTMFMPLMNQALQRLPGETLLTSVVTFRNEPFAQPAPGP